MKSFFAGSDTTDSGRGTTAVTDGPPGSVKLRRSTPGMLGKAKGPHIDDVCKN